MARNERYLTELRRIAEDPRGFELRETPQWFLERLRFDERNEPSPLLRAVARLLIRAWNAETSPQEERTLTLRFGALCELERFRRMEIIDYRIRDPFEPRPFLTVAKGPRYPLRLEDFPPTGREEHG
ncbi:MAG: hypothetical protein D6795_09125 [Deltaproteobacteria bacterium]|nr:MAG: hypothetical protein D6795_09125 [Deltaproteobacteria bacterium]